MLTVRAPAKINVTLEVLARRMTAARALGYRAGINILSTMGHHNENLPHSLSGDYTRVTDPDMRDAISRYLRLIGAQR